MTQKRDRAWWKQTVQAWRASGKEGREFCAERGLVVKQLYNWSGRLSRERGEDGAEFSQVVLTDAKGPASAEVALGGGRVLRFCGEVSEGQLRALFRAAGSC